MEAWGAWRASSLNQHPHKALQQSRWRGRRHYLPCRLWQPRRSEPRCHVVGLHCTLAAAPAAAAVAAASLVVGPCFSITNRVRPQHRRPSTRPSRLVEAAVAAWRTDHFHPSVAHPSLTASCIGPLTRHHRCSLRWFPVSTTTPLHYPLQAYLLRTLATRGAKTKSRYSCVVFRPPLRI